ncbi:hypothetical protein PG996_015039 [Apiospora saccharicola]|uniref:Uncharacterized protein n=1 Tax=Apiospora saccharicola TaxID=335842 RepID=A0ABR1TK02_9PEZI
MQFTKLLMIAGLAANAAAAPAPETAPDLVERATDVTDAEAKPPKSSSSSGSGSNTNVNICITITVNSESPQCYGHYKHHCGWKDKKNKKYSCCAVEEQPT